MNANGTTYKDKTPPEVVKLLEWSRETGRRIRVHYGDTETGQDWGDVYDVEGRIGRSTGPVKIPLMIHNSRSTGGPGVLDHCIVRIRPAGHAAEHPDWYRHPDYKPPAKADYPEDWDKHFADPGEGA